MTIADLLEMMDEAARYTSTSPEIAGSLARNAEVALRTMRVHHQDVTVLDRLAGNLDFGIRYRNVDPEVLRGYLIGAKLEIQAISRKSPVGN